MKIMIEKSEIISNKTHNIQWQDLRGRNELRGRIDLRIEEDHNW